jgi:septal ring factor EnvC (AmiA/AmiB activator)
VLWFRSRKDAAPELAILQQQIGKLSEEVESTQRALRELEGEQITLHKQVRTWMRRAVAAERNQERAAEGGPPAPATPAPSATPWGARGRILARACGPARVEVEPSTDSGESNGVGP